MPSFFRSITIILKGCGQRYGTREIFLPASGSLMDRWGAGMISVFIRTSADRFSWFSRPGNPEIWFYSGASKISFSIIDALVTKAKGFLLAPVETFQQSKADEPSAVFTYFGVFLLINALLSAVIAMFIVQLFPGLDNLPIRGPLPALVFLAMFVGGFIITFVFAAWLHLCVYILGGRKGIMQTVRAVMYGSTLCLHFGWIPFFSFIFALWSFVLWILGVRELQEMSTGKAVAAVIIAVIIPLIVLMLLFAYLFISAVTTTQVSPPPFDSF